MTPCTMRRHSTMELHLLLMTDVPEYVELYGQIKTIFRTVILILCKLTLFVCHGELLSIQSPALCCISSDSVVSGIAFLSGLRFPEM